jgi:hypothetical protein
MATLGSATFDFQVDPGERLYVLSNLRARSRRGGIANAESTLTATFSAGNTGVLDAAFQGAVVASAPGSMVLLIPSAGLMVTGVRRRRR